MSDEFISEGGKLYQRIILHGDKATSDAEVERLRQFLFEVYQRGVQQGYFPPTHVVQYGFMSQ